jgi:hypothetical protein
MVVNEQATPSRGNYIVSLAINASVMREKKL